jgi:hypothetical protein
MTSFRFRGRFGPLALVTLLAMLIVAQPGRGQHGFRGRPPEPPRMPGPGFSGVSGGFSGNGGGISGGFTGSFSGISGATGISGGFSGFPRHWEPPKIVTIWSCLRCGREVSRGDFPPTGPCPHCRNTGIPNNPGGWNRPPTANVPPQNQPFYPPANVPPRSTPENQGIEPSPGGFFNSSQGAEESTEPAYPYSIPTPSRPETARNETPVATSSSGRGTVLVVIVVLLLILGIAAGILVMITQSRKNRYECRSSPRRRYPEPASSARRRYRD